METRNILKNREILSLILIVIVAALYRILPHVPNIAPVTGLALFSGRHLDGWKRFLAPLSIMFLSDLVLGFHATMPYVYGSFMIIVVLGKHIKKVRAPMLFSITISASLLFFLVTNFGVWASTKMYAHNLTGLINAYYMGLPFLRNTVVGDLVYTFTLFYGYEYCIKSIPGFKTSEAH